MCDFDCFHLFFRVLEALTRKFYLGENVDLGEVSRKCSGTFTGADLYALCADAWMTAAKRKVRKISKMGLELTIFVAIPRKMVTVAD